jgi:hypothetical protein
MNILLDMDGVICTEEPTFERSLAKPLPGAKESIDILRDQGHKVIIYTARSWSELEMTKKWLQANNIEVDGIHMGKPVADRIVDDRAINFHGWPAALEALSKNSKPDVDSIYLKILRDATKSYLKKICTFENIDGPVLEVGPMTKAGKNSPIYGLLPDTYYDSRNELTSRGLEYISVDIDSKASPDICCDFLSLGKRVPEGSIGTIILLSVIEHIPKLFEVPNVINYLLKSKGRAYILTPWNLRFHGPRPDCWRISDDGYIALFSEHFNILNLNKIEAPGRPLSPVGISICIEKKN